MQLPNRVVIDETIMSGKPVIKGTRVPCELVIGQLSGGMTFEEVMREYDLEKEDILAALAYAANLLAGEEVLLSHG